jgi:flagellar hook-basal body complex protein FliE
MDDLKISSISHSPVEGVRQAKQNRHDPFSDFKEILSKTIQEVNSLQSQANQSVQGMVLGQKDIHNTMIDMEKAGISFRLMLQVRNKMIAAYEETMRIQI